NALLLGEPEARHLGFDVERIKRELILCTALGVGAAVAAAGLIGFVGLVVPHLMRQLVGPDHRLLLPASALAGGALLLLADLFAGALPIALHLRRAVDGSEHRAVLMRVDRRATGVALTGGNPHHQGAKG